MRSTHAIIKQYNAGLKFNGEFVNISKSAVHLGHTVSSDKRSQIVKSATGSFWRGFNLFLSNFESLCSSMKSKLFSQFCCSFYGAPLWELNSVAVHALCVDWRKALRSLWKVSPRTHCDVITALSDQIPLMISLEQRFMKFINKSLSSSNSFVKLISQLAVRKPHVVHHNYYYYY